MGHMGLLALRGYVQPVPEAFWGLLLGVGQLSAGKTGQFFSGLDK